MQSIGKIISQNRKKKKLSQQELVQLLSQEGIHVTPKALSKWETDVREPGLHTFFTVCRILGVEDIYAAYFGKNPYNIFDDLNEEGKDRLKDYARILKASGLFRADTQKVIPFRMLDIYEDCVSAGTGNFLTDAPKESYEAGDLAPECTDFGVKISGDSMEPDYHDGEIAWIQQKESIDNGEVGIFYLNGEAYIKKLYRSADRLCLISLNSQYQPITVRESDSFRIYGKVVGKCKPSDIPGMH